MKNLLLALTLCVTGFTAQEALVTKSTGSGFVPPEYARSEQCQVFSNRVVITKGYGYQNNGGAVLVETRNIQLKANEADLLARVAKEQVKEGNPGPCDIPVTTITAGKDILLYQTGACGAKTKTREGAVSRILTEIVNNYCAKTVRFEE